MAKSQPVELNPVHVANILDTIGRATSDTSDAGMRWYSDWSEYLWRVSVQRDVRFDLAVSVFACLSANKGLTGNLRMFHRWLDSGIDAVNEAATAQKVKVRALMASAAPLALLTSPKVGSFAANLAGNTTRATIDRHAAQCAHDDRGIDKVPPRMYRILELAYQEAAAMLGLETRQTQAIAWCVWRAEKPNLRGLTRLGDPDIAALLAALPAAVTWPAALAPFVEPAELEPDDYSNASLGTCTQCGWVMPHSIATLCNECTVN